jgi:flavin reductase ActVB
VLDVSDLKNALANFPSGVVVATTVDVNGEPRGFTASSFSSVSLKPPLISVCLANDAECYEAFRAAERFAISVLGASHEEIAMRFATRGAEKFATGLDESIHSLKVVSGALSTMICRIFSMHDCGDHTILVGEVEAAKLATTGDAMVLFRRRFHPLVERPEAAVAK